MAFNGAEPVRAETLERFAEAFAPLRLPPRGVLPLLRPGRGDADRLRRPSGAPRRRCVRAADALERGEAARWPRPTQRRAGRWWAAAASLAGAASCSSSTRRRGARCRRARWARSGSRARAWPRLLEPARGDARATFQARTAGRATGPFLRTGDLGFLARRRAVRHRPAQGPDHPPRPQPLPAGHRADRRAEPPGAAARAAARPSPSRWTARSGWCVVHEVDARAAAAMPVEDVAARHPPRGGRGARGAASTRVVLHRAGQPCPRRPAARSSATPAARPIWTARSPWLPPGEAGGHRRRNARGRCRRGPRHRGAPRAWLAGEVAARAGVARRRWTSEEPLHRYALDSLHAMELTHAVEERLGLRSPWRPSSTAPAWPAGGGRPAPPVGAPAAAARRRGAPIEPRAGEAVPSHGQRALWFLHLLAPAARPTTCPARCASRGGGRPGPARHLPGARRPPPRPALDLHLPPGGTGAARPRVHAEVATFHQERVARWTEAEIAAAASSAEAGRRPFDLEAGRCCACICSRSRQEHVLLCAAPHRHRLLVAGGAARGAGRALPGAQAERPPRRTWSCRCPRAYADYVRWQAEMLAGARPASGWGLLGASALAGQLPALDLPTDRPRPPVQTFRRARTPSGCPRRPRLCERGWSAGATGATPFMTLLAAFQVLLHRYTGQQDFLRGLGDRGPRPRRLRGHRWATSSTRWCCAPTCAAHTHCPSAASWPRCARRRWAPSSTRTTPSRCWSRPLQPERDPSRSPLFQVMFVLQKAPRSTGAGPHRPSPWTSRGRASTVGGLPLESCRCERADRPVRPHPHHGRGGGAARRLLRLQHRPLRRRAPSSAWPALRAGCWPASPPTPAAASRSCRCSPRPSSSSCW